MPITTHRPLPRPPIIALCVAWLLLAAAFVPHALRGGGPVIALDGALARIAGILTNVTGLWGIPFVAVCTMLLIATRPGLAWGQRLLETGALLVALIIVLAGGAVLNSLVIQPALGVPRPNLVLLEEDTTLEISLGTYYSLESDAERSKHLAQVLEDPNYDGISLVWPVRVAWVRNPGYAFPVGAAVGTMFLAALALFGTAELCPCIRAGLAYGLLPWAVLAGWSRVALLLASPKDVTFSALLGLLLGAGVYLLLRRILWPQIASHPV